VRGWYPGSYLGLQEASEDIVVIVNGNGIE
jgi:hypothetical protein